MEMATFDGVIPFAVYFVGGVSALLIFLRVYLWVTPYDDLQMIREGNTSAAITIVGTLIGYSIPLAKVIEQAYGLMDFIAWGLVAMLAQAVVFVGVCKIFPNFVDQIKKDRIGEAVVLAALSIAVGLISAAAMTE